MKKTVECLKKKGRQNKTSKKEERYCRSLKKEKGEKKKRKKDFFYVYNFGKFDVSFYR